MASGSRIGGAPARLTGTSRPACGTRPRTLLRAALACAALAPAACGGGANRSAPVDARTSTAATHSASAARPHTEVPSRALYRVPQLLNPHNVYAADRRGALSPTVRRFRSLVYVPNSGSDSVEEIDPRSYRVVRRFGVGALPQHVVPAYDLRTLWVTNDIGNSLTPINPANGIPGHPVPVEDPYNMYFTPDGRYAIVMAERLRRINFLDAHTMKMHHPLSVPLCAGVNHADFTADGRLMLVSCEYAARMIVVDVPAERVVRNLRLPPGASPQDVKLSPDGRVFYVADLTYGGVWELDASSFRRIGFLRTGAGAHGLYPSRNTTRLFVSNRSAGTVSVVSFASRRVVATWKIPDGSPDMGGVSASGRVLWLSGRYDAAVYAIDTRTGRLIRRIPVGFGPHGLCVYPQPGRYSLGHTGVFR